MLRIAIVAARLAINDLVAATLVSRAIGDRLVGVVRVVVQQEPDLYLHCTHTIVQTKDRT